MSGKPMLLLDIERMRNSLTIEPFERARVIVGASDRKLSFDLECIACEELLEWASAKGWWICPECGQEVTDKEAADLLRACYEGFKEVVGDEDAGESSEGKDEGKGVGRWVRRVMEISRG